MAYRGLQSALCLRTLFEEAGCIDEGYLDPLDNLTDTEIEILSRQNLP